MRLRMQRISPHLRLCMGIAAIAYLQLLPAAGQQTPSRLRLGSFSVVMPVPARVVNTQNGNGSVATVYAAVVSPVTFFLSFIRFSSPQQTVTPQQFAHNVTANAKAQILGVWRVELAGYPADKVLYRIGQMTVMAWSVQPSAYLNYILSVNGPDSPEFRSRAEQYACSFRVGGRAHRP